MKHFLGKFYKNFYWSLKAIVTMGCALLLILMMVMALIGLSQMAQNNARMEQVINEQSAKTALISSMRNIARDRIVLLFTAIALTDPFKRDEAISKFRKLASDFLTLREQFEATRLNPVERAQFSRILETTRIAAELQSRVVDLIGISPLEAQQTLITSAVPAQNQVIATYDRFLDLQNQKSKDSINEAKETNHETYFAMILLVTLALILGSIVAIFVIRRISRIEDALFEEKELAEITLHSIAEGVITTDEAGNVTYLNPVAEQLTGWQAIDVQQKHLDDIYNIINESTKLPSSNRSLLPQLDGPTVPLGNRILIQQGGRQFAIQDSIAPIRNKTGHAIGAVVVFNDVSEARSLTQKLSWQACHDALTGLVNRLEFERQLSFLLESARNQDRQHFLLFMDLDQFKLINDTCGHIAGDELLKQLSRSFETAIRGNDTLARLGGDEFGVLLESCPLKHAVAIAENIRQLVASLKFSWEGKSFQIGVSIGLVPINSQSGTAIEIMGLADSACYKAKNDGRNQIQILQGHDQIVSRRYQTQSVLTTTKALEENRFCLYHQKILPTAKSESDNTAIHYEILLRMLDENNNVILPGSFIPVSERYNLMPKIDRWVINNLFKCLSTHSGISSEQSIYSVNLSGQSLIDDRFLDYVIDQFEKFEIPGQKIGFEITETSAIANLSKAVHFISVLKERGCAFLLDDFGSGMSSYNYLKNLHIDYLKIDGAFVKNMVQDKIDHAMVESINRIGHVMGIKTIAEFVENAEIYRQLGDLGVDYAQGYGIHKPEPLFTQLRIETLNTAS